MHFKTKNSQKIKLLKPQSAFTIVELLVVIVIIGILATIVIIFYIGTHDKAIDGSLQADLKGASTVLELDKANGDLYPSTKESANDSKGLKSSNGTTLDYAYSSGDNSYCLTATKEGRSYYINSEGRVPVQGSCPVGSAEGAVANSFVWTWGGTGYERGSNIIKIDNGYIVTGAVASFGVGNYDSYISKHTNDGELAWSKTWGGAQSDMGDRLIEDKEGNYVVVGRTNSFSGNINNYDGFIAKYTSNGELMWNKVLGGSIADLIFDIIEINDGSYVVCGYTSSADLSTDNLISKFTNDGTLAWSKAWGSTGYDQVSSIVQTNDGGYITAGMTNSYGNGSLDASITKFTSNGDIVWNKTWGGAGDEYGYSVNQDSNGEYVMTGYTQSYGVGNKDLFIAKFNNNGNLIWNKTWGGAGDEYGNSIAYTKSNDYVIIGSTTSYGAGNSDTLLIKFTSNGNMEWNKTWGGAGDDYGYSILLDNNSVVYTGATNSYGAGNFDMLLAKSNDEGEIINCPTNSCKEPIATIVNPESINNNHTNLITDVTTSIIDPNAISTIPQAEVHTIIAPDTLSIFKNKELYIEYVDINQATCKNWTAPDGKNIKGITVSQATESGYDYFTVYLDEVVIYKKSGNASDIYTGTLDKPGTKLKACLSTDNSVQNGYGGEVTGVFYE